MDWNSTFLKSISVSVMYLTRDSSRNKKENVCFKVFLLYQSMLCVVSNTISLARFIDSHGQIMERIIVIVVIVTLLHVLDLYKKQHNDNIYKGIL